MLPSLSLGAVEARLGRFGGKERIESGRVRD